MPSPPEEAGEEVEGVLRPSSGVSLFVLLETFMSVLVVDPPRFGRGEGFVGFGDLDEALGGGVVATVCG